MTRVPARRAVRSPVEPTDASLPRMRADARRNEEAVLEAAKVVFARSGVDAPIREIATQAAVTSLGLRFNF